MDNYYDSGIFIKKIFAELKAKRERELLHRRYAGACYDILKNYRAIPIVAVDLTDGVISKVLVAFVQNGKYCEAILSKSDLISVIENNEDYPFCSPNLMGYPTPISVIEKKYVRTDQNNTKIDNLGYLLSIAEWKASNARKYLLKLFATLK